MSWDLIVDLRRKAIDAIDAAAKAASRADYSRLCDLARQLAEEADAIERRLKGEC